MEIYEDVNKRDKNSKVPKLYMIDACTFMCNIIMYYFDWSLGWWHALFCITRKRHGVTITTRIGGHNPSYGWRCWDNLRASSKSGMDLSPMSRRYQSTIIKVYWILCLTPMKGYFKIKPPRHQYFAGCLRIVIHIRCWYWSTTSRSCGLFSLLMTCLVIHVHRYSYHIRTISQPSRMLLPYHSCPIRMNIEDL